LELERAALAGSASAALELGATYDPVILAAQGSRPPLAAVRVMAEDRKQSYDERTDADIEKARFWYQKARDLGSSEAQARLERLAKPLE
jgi:TPR repeat protein